MTELVLHEACAIGDYEALEEYLKTGKYDPNCRDDEWGGKAPLHWACIRGSIECTRLLLSIGVNGNIRTDTGWTPAHFAAEGGRIHVLRALHTANIRLDEKCYYDDTPLKIAKRYNHEDSIKFLESVYDGYNRKVATDNKETKRNITTPKKSKPSSSKLR